MVVRWLVEGADANLVEMSGGHAGFETHKEEFVALVRGIARRATASEGLTLPR